MSKTLILFCFAIAVINCNAQQTQTPIIGIDAIKLGDPISIVNNYGFPFKAIAKYRFSDSVYIGSAFAPKQTLLGNKAKAAETKTEYIYVDSGKTFCADVAVFITNSFAFKQLKHSTKATLALTYFKNTLIEIRIIDSAQYIKAEYSYGISRYGTNFGKTFNAAKGHIEARENATHPGWKTETPKVDISKTAIATISKQLSDDNFLESIFWQNNNNSFSYNYCSAPLRFWANKFKPTHGWGCAEGVMIIKNEEAYKAMTDCSDKTIIQTITTM
jgi:hypothetical protein